MRTVSITYIAALATAVMAFRAVPVAGQDSTARLPVKILPKTPKPPAATHTVVMVTSFGEIEAELYGRDAPLTVGNFTALAQKGFYNGLSFHRCVPQFIIQTGDPYSRDTNRRSAWGSGGISIYDGEFGDELDPLAPSYKRGYVEGTLAMANSGPNTNLSQFFIVCGPQALLLPKAYTIFGRVIRGMDVVHRIEMLPADDDDTPYKPVFIRKLTVKDGKPKKKKTTPAAGDTARATTQSDWQKTVREAYETARKQGAEESAEPAPADPPANPTVPVKPKNKRARPEKTPVEKTDPEGE